MTDKDRKATSEILAKADASRGEPTWLSSASTDPVTVALSAIARHNKEFNLSAGRSRGGVENER